LAGLKNQEAVVITKQISTMMGSHNSPQARSSIQAVIDLANRETPA
jgi:hypothetical protein